MINRSGISLPDIVPGFSVNLASALTIPNNTVTNITWGATEWDVGHMVDPAGIAMWATRKGRYILQGQLIFTTGAASGQRWIIIQKNSGTIAGFQRTTDLNSRFQVVAIANAGLSDYFALAVYQNSGGDANLSGSVECHFRGNWIGEP